MDTNQEIIYTCPMHQEVKGNKGEKCPKCGMELKPVNKTEAKKFDVKISSSPTDVEAGKPTHFTIAVMDKDKIVPLEVVHEMKMHLLVVNEELTWFNHIHPEEQDDATYRITETFPTSGKYLMYVDYKPEAKEGSVYKHTLNVEGNKAEMVTLDRSPRFTSNIDGYTAKLLNGDNLETNRSQELQFVIEKNGYKLDDAELQNYLGAKAHIVMISKNDKDFLHIHPMSDGRFQIYAETRIVKHGLYRMWMQFKIDGKVHTADFTVNVSEGNEPQGNHGGHHHKH